MIYEVDEAQIVTERESARRRLWLQRPGMGHAGSTRSAQAAQKSGESALTWRLIEERSEGDEWVPEPPRLFALRSELEQEQVELAPA